MLIDSKGRRVHPAKLPKTRAARTAALAALTEVQSPRRDHGEFFTLEARATLRVRRK